jgi:hypothetical protein
VSVQSQQSAWFKEFPPQVIIDEAITKLDEDFFWLGGGEVDLKLGMPTSQFLNAFRPFVVKCSWRPRMRSFRALIWGWDVCLSGAIYSLPLACSHIVHRWLLVRCSNFSSPVILTETRSRSSCIRHMHTWFWSLNIIQHDHRMQQQ